MILAYESVRIDATLDVSGYFMIPGPGARGEVYTSLLRSEHIVRVIDLDTLADGSPYIAMEFLEGEDLGAVLARRGPLPAQLAATYIVQVCEEAREAASRG